MAVNAAMAADGLLMPLPAKNLDYANSVSYWTLLQDLMVTLGEGYGVKKDFAFMRVLLNLLAAPLPDFENCAEDLAKVCTKPKNIARAVEAVRLVMDGKLKRPIRVAFLFWRRQARCSTEAGREIHVAAHGQAKLRTGLKHPLHASCPA